MTTQVINTVIASWGPETVGVGGRGRERKEGRRGERVRRKKRRGKVKGMITRL